MVNRLFRKFKSKVKIQELAVFVAALMFAAALGRGFAALYHTADRGVGLVAAVNGLGGQNEKTAAPNGSEINAYPQNGLVASQNEERLSGLVAVSQNDHRTVSGGYTASYLALSGETKAVQHADAVVSDQANHEGEHVTEDENSQFTEIDHINSETEIQKENPNTDEAVWAHWDINDTTTPDGGTAAEEAQPYMVKVVVDGERYVYQTAGMKVSELFEQKGIVLSKADRLYGAYLDGTINSDLYIEVKRITQKTVTEEVVIPSKTVYRDNPDLATGKSNVIRSGADGRKRVEYLISYENGIQVDKQAVKEEVLAEAVSKIVEQGSHGTKVGNDGVPFKYAKVLDVKCTAYTASYEDTGKRPGDPAFGITASGLVAREGVVAVDPSVIPLGTKIYIDILDESIEDYGYAIAGDTGGKIKGKKVDLYFDASREAILQFGVRKAKVYILE
ncbi:MAG: G5 domain-containing protein [Clostridiales bacterium]|nr:G5 domain-containing protein [Clostridiales bacterium]